MRQDDTLQRVTAKPLFTEAHRAAFEEAKHTSDLTSVNKERRSVSDRFLELHKKR